MAWNGQLNHNEIFSAIYNMIISQEVFADNFGNHQTLVDKARVDGGMYGDTKLYYATQVLKSAAWTKDSEAANLLNVRRPAAPNCQAIGLDQFRIVDLTIDNWMSKRAFADEGSFSAFNSVMLGWLRETKRMYEGTLYNCYVGTSVSSTGKQKIQKTLTSGSEGKELAELVANLVVSLGDYSKDYNDLGYFRSYSPEQVQIIWNSDYVNKIKFTELPALYHKDLIEKMFNNAEVIPARYFGTVITNANKDDYADNTPAAGKPLDKDGTYAYTPGISNANGCVRSLIETDVTVGGTAYHLYPGDEIPANTKLATSVAAGTLKFGEVYIQAGVGSIDPVYAKVVTKLPVIMSGFEAGTSFFNPRSLTESHYLIWSYNTLDYFKDKPFITISK